MGPEEVTLAALRRGGDRRWRQTMARLGPRAAGAAAGAVARLALDAYRSAPDGPVQIERRAAEAVADLPGRGIAFALAVEVGGPLRGETGFRGQSLGRVIGSCASVWIDPDNPRHVRWLGEAAEVTCLNLGVDERVLCAAVAAALQPFVLKEDGPPAV